MSVKSNNRGDIAEQEILYVPIDSVKPHPKNPNNGRVDVIEASIQHRSLYGVIIVQRSTGYILAGEHRWRALKNRGLAREIPACLLNVDDKQALEILLSDNSINHLGRLDAGESIDIINELLGPSPDDDELFDLGFNERSYQDLINQLEYRPPEILPPEPPVPDQEFKVIVTCGTQEDQLMIAELMDSHGFPYRLTPRDTT
jgi:ParB-like chromosome segregation protein Spo0J